MQDGGKFYGPLPVSREFFSSIRANNYNNDEDEDEDKNNSDQHVSTDTLRRPRPCLVLLPQMAP